MDQIFSACAAAETIEDRNLHTQVAYTIWWDYFSNREGKDAWHHLDRFLAAWTKDISITAADHRAALVQCGYTPKLADERVPDNHSLFRVNDNQENDHARPHSFLHGKTPAEVHGSGLFQEAS